MTIAVLIPCFNEELTIEKVINDFRLQLPDADIYVYDNNSTDGTVIKAEAAQGDAIVRYEHKQGKGNVIRTMFREIQADVYLLVDGDDTYPAEAAKRMCDEILNNKADMCIGDRLSSTYFQENKRPFHNFGNRLVRFFINFFWKPNIPIYDVMTGYRAFSPLFVKSFPVLSKGFEIETEMTIHALDKNMLITNIPVQYRDRPENSISKLNTFSDGIKVLITIFMLFKNYKPLLFFGFLSLLFASIGLLIFIPIFLNFLSTGFVPKLPSLILSFVLLLSAFLSFTCGLILDTFVKTEKQNAEVQMNIIQLLLLQQHRIVSNKGGDYIKAFNGGTSIGGG